MGFVGQLLAFVSSIYGIVFISLLLWLVAKVNKDIRYLWLLLAFLMYFSSLAKFFDQWTDEPPALIPFLQTIRDNGRPLSILTLIGIVISIHKNKYKLFNGLYVNNESSIQFLVVVQVIIFLKILLVGNMLFAIMAFATFLGVIYIVRNGLSPLIQNQASIEYGVYAILIANIIFLTTNFYQAYIDMYPITFLHGRFLGTTGNPQHAAVLLASSIPAYMYMISRYKISLRMAFICVFLGLNIYALILTGSRTGLLMAFITVSLFIYKGSPLLTTLTAFCAIIILVFYDEINLYIALNDETSTAFGRLSSLEDTRSAAWKGMWETFTYHPIFGKPVIGDRIGFGENSWLATASSLGLIGFIPLFLFGTRLIKLSIIALKQSFSKSINNSDEYKVVATGIISLIAGSFFEAFLLGNLSFSLIILLLYITMLEYLIGRSVTN